MDNEKVFGAENLDLSAMMNQTEEVETVEQVEDTIDAGIKEDVFEPKEVAAQEAVEEKAANESDFTVGEPTQPTDTPKEAVKADWKEVLKTQEGRDEIVKALGFDPFTIELDKHLKQGGSAEDYLQAKAFDYNKVPDATLAIEKLKSEFPNLDEEEIQILFEDKYKQDDYASEDERRKGNILMKADAYKERQDRIAKQDSFKLPQAQQAQSNNTDIESFNKFYDNHPVMQELLSSKRVAVELVEGIPFNFKLGNPEIVKRVQTEPGFFNQITSTPTGEPNVKLLNEIALFALNPVKFKADIFNYAQSLEREKVVDENRNIGKNKDRQAAPQKETFRDAWKNAKQEMISL